MRNKNELSTIDTILGLFFILLCPVVMISIYQWDFSFPLWGYVVFAIATYRMYHLVFKKNNYTKATLKRRYEQGDEIETNVVGVTFENRQLLINKITVGQLVYLTREPDNAYDKNAIKVMVYRHTKDEREVLEPELKNKYGKFSYKEIFEELYAKDGIGYLSRKLAERISPIFDKYAVKPNLFISASVINLTGIENETYSKGIRIRFKLPTVKDLEQAIQREMELDMEMDFWMTHPPL